jgi:hypothetical protein
MYLSEASKLLIEVDIVSYISFECLRRSWPEARNQLAKLERAKKAKKAKRAKQPK